MIHDQKPKTIYAYVNVTNTYSISLVDPAYPQEYIYQKLQDDPELLENLTEICDESGRPVAVISLIGYDSYNPVYECADNSGF